MTGTQRARLQTRNAQDADERIFSLDPESGLTNERRRSLLLRRFWQSASGFWESRKAWLLSGAILLLILLSLAASYGMNLWNRAIFDALEKREAGGVLFLFFTALAKRRAATP